MKLVLKLNKTCPVIFQAIDCLQVARTDIMPNWYVTSPDGGDIRTIKHTEGETINHVGEFDTPEKWKRMEIDTFNPPTPEER